jgi:hypothetical protein
MDAVTSQVTQTIRGTQRVSATQKLWQWIGWMVGREGLENRQHVLLNGTTVRDPERWPYFEMKLAHATAQSKWR